MTFIDVKAVSKSYRESEVPVEVLRSVDLAVAKGEMIAIVGPSGIGKSTLLHLVGGLDRVDSGVIEVGGVEIQNLSNDRLARWRNREVGFIFQFHHLLPEFTARENVAMPGWIAGRNRSEALDEADALLDELGLEERKAHFPSQLSGGEQQRVAIARALAPEPATLLADEPTGNLDYETSERVFELMRQCHRKRGLTSIIVTHNRELASRCDRVLELEPREVR